MAGVISQEATMDSKSIFYLVILAIISLSNLFSLVWGEIRDNSGLNRTRNVNFMKDSNFATNLLNTLKSRRKDKKNFINKKLKQVADTENLKELIHQIDSTGLIRRIIRRRVYIPKDSMISLSSQVSRPNIFPNIFNQGEGFIVDAVIEWLLELDLHAFGIAFGMQTPRVKGGGDANWGMDTDGVLERSGANSSSEPVGPDVSEGKSLSNPTEIIGLERCLIYDKVEVGMSTYLDIHKNQSHDCVLRAVCEAQLVADYYPDAPSSIFFEFVHLVLKPSLSPSRDPCYEEYLNAERSAYKEPDRCSSFVSQCPLNIAGLFVRNFFPEIL